MSADLFVKAHAIHAAEIAKHHRAKLVPRGRYMRGQCPICAAGKTSLAFQAETEGSLWHCHSCGEGGDGVRLEMLLGRHPDRVAAARALTGLTERVTAERQARPERPRDDSPFVESAIVSAYILRTSVPARGGIVEAWLRTRRLDPDGVPGGLDRLRFHPRCPTVPWRRARDPEHGPTAPAMVAPIDRVDDVRQLQRCGVHVTYLRGDGRAKAVLRNRDGSPAPSRKIWGEAKRGGFWLTPVDGDGPLVVGEGIETVWSYAQGLAGPRRACAVLSLNNLQGGWKTDVQDALALWKPTADPARPPALVRDPGEVVLLIDADMKPIRMPRVQLARGGKRGEAWLSQGDRATLCATLAAQHWRGAGATRLTALRPPMGMDFNDAAVA